MNFLALLIARLGGPVFLIRIRFKSGAYQDFYTREFKITVSGNDRTVSWKSVDGASRPLYFGVDNIESAWQLKAWPGLFFGSHDTATKKD